MRSSRSVVLGTLLVLALGACGSTSTRAGSASGSGSASGERGRTGGAETVRWGEGKYAVVLAHGAAFDAASWQDQATVIAESGVTVVAVEDTSPESIKSVVAALQDEGHPDVALVGGSAGADAILELASTEPDLPDQLILLSPNGSVEGLGTEPKLFVASEEEPVADVSTELADAAPGTDNKAVILPGSAHAQNIFATERGPKVLQLMVDRIEQFAA